MGERVFPNRGVCGRAFPILPNHPLFRRVFVLAPIYTRPECEKALCTGTLGTHARLQEEIHIFELPRRLSKLFNKDFFTVVIL